MFCTYFRFDPCMFTHICHQQIYLEKLLTSPLLKDSKIMHGIMNRRTVHDSIVDALDYLVKLIGNFSSPKIENNG